jgi:hypothetical protein
MAGPDRARCREHWTTPYNRLSPLCPVSPAPYDVRLLHVHGCRASIVEAAAPQPASYVFGPGANAPAVVSVLVSFAEVRGRPRRAGQTWRPRSRTVSTLTGHRVPDLESV